jgi:quercetin dioxygenase-like cupin family protein
MLTALHATSVHDTPNARMRRYPGDSVSVWRTTLQPGAAGPVHTIDREQVLVVLGGELTATIDGRVFRAAIGDAVVLPASAVRQLRNDGTDELVTLTAALPGSLARMGDGAAVTVPWSA